MLISIGPFHILYHEEEKIKNFKAKLPPYLIVGKENVNSDTILQLQRFGKAYPQAVRLRHLPL
jgi:hypothetical protein